MTVILEKLYSNLTGVFTDVAFVIYFKIYKYASDQIKIVTRINSSLEI